MTTGTSSALTLAQPTGPGPFTDPGIRAADQSQSCFVIGPTGEPRTEIGSPTQQARATALPVFETIVEPACARLGIGPVRSDQISRTGEITEQVCRQLLAADLVIADVSGGNPDVMYGIGLRHATGKPVIHIGETGQLPFDIAPFHTIAFRRSPTGMADARNELTEVLSLVLREGFDPLIPDRALRSVARPGAEGPPAGGQAGTTPPSGDHPPGLLERFTELAPDLEATSDHIAAIITLVTDIAAAAEQFGPDMRRAARDGSPMSIQLAFTKRLSAALAGPAAKLRESAQRFTERMADIDATVQAALDLFERVPPACWSTDDRGFLSRLVDVSAAARQGAETLALFRTITDVMVAVHRELRGPARDIATAVERLSDAMTVLETWDQRAKRLAT
ncbi:hypothetical protein ACFWNL_15545 [Kitasatospora sp. NPDC058397]|uniref:hypothetical protein n=1 Tax=unclassified Kitasatospora TaxID=2633591 RepID=UPI0036567BDE